MEKKYLVGINLPLRAKAHETGVALIDFEGNIIFAANEERFSRIKLDGDFPEKSIEEMFKHAKISSQEIAYVCVPTLDKKKRILRFIEFLLRERISFLFKLEFFRSLLRIAKIEVADKVNNREKDAFKLKYYWRDFINEKFPNAEIIRIDHHLAHASGAYFYSPFEKSLIITMDGAGNYLTSIIALGENGKIKIIDKTFIPHSAGTFWGSITRICGFKSGTRHGGKVTGLAAHGNPEKLIDKMRQAIWNEGMRIKVKADLFFDSKQFVPDWNSYQPEKLKDFFGEQSREDIAAAAQLRLEEVIVEIIKNALKKTKADQVVLAGGVFANVLLNQKIMQIEGVRDIFIFPAMSDGGLALGAATQALSEKKINEGEKLIPKNIKNVYLGPRYSEEDIISALKKFNLPYLKMQDPAREIAQLIFSNKVVALYQGRMEYGPRALGNRSIIYSPIDPDVNNWLNKQLNRSEFMPFAPVTLIEKIKDCYKGITNDPVAAKFMTITYDCTEEMKKQSPACVHIDGTARPQVLKREDNPYYYDIISEYYKLSGIPTLINTSFNMHEEPIVASPEDAIRAFLDSKINFLVMENILVDYDQCKFKL